MSIKLLLFLIISGVVFSQNNNLLIKAYEANSQAILDEFISKWDAETIPMSNDEIQNENDTIAALYDLYFCFYSCFNSNPMEKYKLERYTNLLTDLKYFVVSSRIKYKVLNLDILDTTYQNFQSEWEAARTDTINNFRPNFELVASGRKIKSLFLTDKFYEYFKEYFKSDETNEELLKEDYEKKKKFLSDYIIVLAKGNTFTPVIDRQKILSDPIIREVDFNKDLTQSRINFSIGCTYYTAFFINDNEGWKVVNCKMDSTC